MQDWYLVKSLCIMLVSCEGAHQNLQGLFTFALPRVLVLPVFGRESKKKCSLGGGVGKGAKGKCST